MHEPGGGEAVSGAAGREMQRDAICVQVERALAPVRRMHAPGGQEPARRVLDEGEPLGAAAMQQVGVLQFRHDGEQALNGRALWASGLLQGVLQRGDGDAEEGWQASEQFLAGAARAIEPDRSGAVGIGRLAPRFRDALTPKTQDGFDQVFAPEVLAAPAPPSAANRGAG